MNRITLLIITILLASTGAMADMRESRITFLSDGQEVVGTLNLPSGDPAPVVLLLHGFTGSRNELQSDFVKQGVFAYTAEQLSNQNIASLRIDFRGSGESVADLEFADTTFERQVTDGIAAIEYLQSLDTVDTDSLYIVGWSQGGLVSTAVAGRTNAPDAVALWAAVADAQSTFTGVLGEDVMTAGSAAGSDEPVEAELPWGAKIALKGAFFDGIETFNPLAEIANYQGPLFIAQGLNDTAVSPDSADALLAAHDGEQALWKTDMDHVFNIFTTADTLDQLVAKTVSFFRDNQEKSD